MAIYDRDYIRQPAGASSFGGVRLWSMNTWLIVINVVIFLLNNLISFTQYDSLGDAVSISHPIAQWDTSPSTPRFTTLSSGGC